MTTTQNMYKDKRSASERLSALERTVSALENTIPAVIQAVGRQIDPLTKDTRLLTEAVNELRMLVDVLVGLNDQNVIAEKIREARIAQANAEMEAEDKDTLLNVEKGILVEAKEVAEDSLIVISSVDPSGTPSIPDHRRVAVQAAKAEVKPLLVGKTEGDSITLPDGSTVTIRKVYKIDQVAALKQAKPE